MPDIVSIFPTANEIKDDNVNRYSLYLFEHELCSILELIVWAKTRNFNQINVHDLSTMAHDFLVEKGYNVIRNIDKSWQIGWGA